MLVLEWAVWGICLGKCLSICPISSESIRILLLFKDDTDNIFVLGGGTPLNQPQASI